MTTTDAVECERLTPVRPSFWRRLSGLRLMAIGMLLLQLAWLVAVPPFRGSDEFDHAFKAAAVARGEWFPSPTAATRGTGAWVHVPADLVSAARPQCQALPYTRNDDCVGTRKGDTVRVASGAGRYNPVFYAVVGTPALPFSGYHALYVMRLATVLLGWLLFCGAIAATRGWATSPWPFVALAVASTPVLVYSASVVAPNGVEMMAAMMFWASLIGLARGGATAAGSTVSDGRQLSLAAVSGAILVTTRSLGPVWCLLAVLTVAVALRPSRNRWRDLGRRRSAWAAGCAVVAATLLSTWWILKMGPLKLATGAQPATPLSLGARVRTVLHDVPVSMLQSIAAFPFRNQPTQPVVYACFLVLFIGVLIVALRASTTWPRAAIVATCVVAVAAPVLIQVATYNQYGSQWQGRYALPYAVGTVLVAGAALDRHGARRVPPQLTLIALMLFVVAQAVGPVDVFRNESRHSPLAGTSAWFQPSPWAIGLSAVVGAALLLLGATRAGMKESLQ